MSQLPCSGNVDGKLDNLAPEHYDDFVDYLTEVAAFYKYEMNMTFRTIAPFNEPSAGSWYAGNVQEGCHYDPSTQNIILQASWVYTVGMHSKQM